MGDEWFIFCRRNASTFAQKQNSSNAVLILKAESTLLSVLKTLDGDYVKNQVNIRSNKLLSDKYASIPQECVRWTSIAVTLGTRTGTAEIWNTRYRCR